MRISAHTSMYFRLKKLRCISKLLLCDVFLKSYGVFVQYEVSLIDASHASDCYTILSFLQAHTSEGVHHFMCGASGSEMRHGSGLYEGAHDNMSLDWVSKQKR